MDRWTEMLSSISPMYDVIVARSSTPASVCSETCGTSVQRPRGRHGGNVDGAAVPGERGLPSPPVPLVPQRRGASAGLQNQSQVHQLLLQHQPRHRRPGETLQGGAWDDKGAFDASYIVN